MSMSFILILSETPPLRKTCYFLEGVKHFGLKHEPWCHDISHFVCNTLRTNTIKHTTIQSNICNLGNLLLACVLLIKRKVQKKLIYLYQYFCFGQYKYNIVWLEDSLFIWCWPCFSGTVMAGISTATDWEYSAEGWSKAAVFKHAYMLSARLQDWLEQWNDTQVWTELCNQYWKDNDIVGDSSFKRCSQVSWTMNLNFNKYKFQIQL